MPGKNNKAQMTMLKSLIKEMIYNLVKEDKKPGGPITDFGALYKLDPTAAESEAIKALASTDGNVEKAADEIDLSKRRFYDYLNKSGRIEKAKERIESEEEKKEDIENQKRKNKEEEGSKDQSSGS